jgi:hypothetical protein
VKRERIGAQEKREAKRNQLGERENAAVDDNSSTSGEERRQLLEKT